MRLALWTVPVVCGLAGPAAAQDGERFAERTPLPNRPVPHTLERAGHPDTVAWWAIPSVGRHDVGGYVGGGSLRGNSPLARGPAATAGAPGVGTFGSDFAGFRLRPGRVFLGASADPSGGSMIAANYRSEGLVHVPDVLALRPLRKAILARREAAEERKHGGEHGEGGGHKEAGEHKESADHKEAGEKKGAGDH